jgi:hypothetical protein
MEDSTEMHDPIVVLFKFELFTLNFAICTLPESASEC